MYDKHQENKQGIFGRDSFNVSLVLLMTVENPVNVGVHTDKPQGAYSSPPTMQLGNPITNYGSLDSIQFLLPEH